jgi:hypothetical protein
MSIGFSSISHTAILHILLHVLLNSLHLAVNMFGLFIKVFDFLFEQLDHFQSLEIVLDLI